MTTALRRGAVLLFDVGLFAYAAAWLVIGGLALAGPEVSGVQAIASYATAAAAFALAVTTRLRAAHAPAVPALARLVLLFGTGVLTNMGPPWRLLEAAGAAPLILAMGARGGVADAMLNVVWFWWPVRPHWIKVAALLHFTAIYPRPLPFRAPWRRALAHGAILWGAGFLVSSIWALVEMWAPAPGPAIALGVSMALLPAAGLLTFANVRAAYRSATPEERGRLWGLMAAVLVALAGELLYHVWPTPLIGRPPGVVGAIHYLTPVAASLLLVYAVFVRGGLSPRLVVRRTALYGALSVLAIFTFAVLDELLSSVLVTRLGVSEGMVSTLTVATLAVLLKPVHDRLSGWLNARLATWSPNDAARELGPGAAGTAVEPH